MENQKSTISNGSNKFILLSMSSFIIGMILIVIWGVSEWSKNREFQITATAEWNALKTKSNVHEDLVSTYRNCRHEYLANSIDQCIVRTYEYGRAKSYSASETNTALGDILKLSDSIKERYRSK